MVAKLAPLAADLVLPVPLHWFGTMARLQSECCLGRGAGGTAGDSLSARTAQGLASHGGTKELAR